MQVAQDDQKIKVIFDNYSDSIYAQNAQKEVETLRKKAFTYGAGISTVAFVGNEMARVSMRSPLFKLKLQNVAFFLIAPSYMTKLAFQQQVDKRIENMWRVHKNRVNAGKGATIQGSGFHESMNQDYNLILPNATLTEEMIIDGAIMDHHFDNPFLRWHESFEKYSSFLTDMDDVPMHETDEFERIKMTKAKKKDVVGVTPILPRQDSDEIFEFYDIQGESLYSNPPNPNSILVDHGLDEEHIWAFQHTLFNQDMIKNPYMDSGTKAANLSYAPFWGEKLSQPHYFKHDKMPKFQRHWNHRLGLEVLKMNHAINYGPNASDKQKQAMQNEISQYITDCYQAEQDVKMKDVYVTDHSPVEEKFVSNGEEEDEDFFAYQQSLDAYNADTSSEAVFTPKKPIYEKGSLMQKLLDPFAESTRDDEGTIIYTVEEKEMDNFKLKDDDFMKAAFEQMKSKQEVWDVDAEDEDAFRLAMLQELEEGVAGFQIEEFHNALDKELGIFGKNEQYSYVKDLKDAHSAALKTSTEEKILGTIPDHVFWDIKKPLNAREQIMQKNRYNPFRGKEFDSFFEMRDNEDYMEKTEKKENINSSISNFRKY